jgi:hypothetical protein
MVLRGATSLRGALEGVGPENRDFFGPWNGTSKASAIWAQKSQDFQGPPLPMPQIMMLHPSKPLSISAIKTTGTLVVLCTRVMLCSVVVCKRGGRPPCSCVVWGGIQGVVAGWQGSPPPLTIEVSMDACWWGGGGCYSYIRFYPSLAVSWLAHTTHRSDHCSDDSYCFRLYMRIE